MSTQQPIARNLLRTRDYVDARYAEQVDDGDMARVAGYSRAHFTREFKQAFGETPRSYLLTRRLERAAALLHSTDWPVSEVCWAVGITSVGSFTTAFRRMLGVTPTDWRASGPPPETLALVPLCVPPSVPSLRSAPHQRVGEWRRFRFRSTVPPGRSRR